MATPQGNQVGSESIQKQNKMPLNTFTIGIGRASEFRSGASFSNIGFDYLRRIYPKWELGLQLARIAAFSVTQKWPVFAGFGIAGEEDHTEGFFRVGSEYTFFIDKKQMFFIAPGTFLDITVNDAAFSVMIALGINW